MNLQPIVSRLIVTHGSTLVLRACFSFGLNNLMVSRHAARQSNVVWGGIKLCFGGNSQWQVTTVSHKVSSPHRDSFGCGVEREQPCKSTSYQSKWHANNLAPYFWTPKVETLQSLSQFSYEPSSEEWAAPHAKVFNNKAGLHGKGIYLAVQCNIKFASSRNRTVVIIANTGRIKSAHALHSKSSIALFVTSFNGSRENKDWFNPIGSDWCKQCEHWAIAESKMLTAAFWVTK